MAGAELYSDERFEQFACFAAASREAEAARAELESQEAMLDKAQTFASYAPTGLRDATDHGVNILQVNLNCQRFLWESKCYVAARRMIQYQMFAANETATYADNVV